MLHAELFTLDIATNRKVYEIIAIRACTLRYYFAIFFGPVVDGFGISL